MEHVDNLSKGQKRKQRQQQNNNNGTLRLNRISPLTETQSLFFNCYHKYDVISMHGYPGTGKSMLSLFKALESLEQSTQYQTVKIIRSSVSVRDVGFLPGGVKEKMAAFESPYVSLCTELYGRGDAYKILQNKKQLEFIPTTHMRGVTFKNCIVIIDECQNMSYQELNTLMTRIGENCKLILCGDIYQDDLTSERYNEKSGYADVLQILDKISSCKSINFTVDDIVRSGFVKDYIIAKIKFERSEKVRSVPFLR